LEIVTGPRKNTSKNRKKILDRGNELKDLLKIKELAVFGAKNKLVFERKTGLSKRKLGAKIDELLRVS
jgi:hypothetical protein